MINDGEASALLQTDVIYTKKLTRFTLSLSGVPYRPAGVIRRAPFDICMNMYVTASARRRVTSRDSPDLAAARRVAVAPGSAVCTFVMVFGVRRIRSSDPAS